MFSGKGGVGKTTTACGFARRWARQFPDERIVLLSTDPAHSLGDVLQTVVDNTPRPSADLENLQVRSLDAKALLEAFRGQYGTVLELLVERGSFVEGDDLSPVWDMGWPGLDELMALLEIERILREEGCDRTATAASPTTPVRVVVDMAPSGHTLSLFSLMDFLDTLLAALDQFQEKHRYMTQALSGRYTPDQADQFIQDMQRDLQEGRALLQDCDRTACWIVAIPEPMSLLESQRFAQSLDQLKIPVGGFIVNRLTADKTATQHQVLQQFQALAGEKALWGIPLQPLEPLGSPALDALIAQMRPLTEWMQDSIPAASPICWPDKVPPTLPDFVAEGRRLILVGGKGGVGKTTVSAAISWAMAQRHPHAAIRSISIDPAHSLGDAFGCPLSHEPTHLRENLTAQEVDAHIVLDDFRQEYLWELAEMMSGDVDEDSGLQLAYGPQAWRQIVAQALPGIDEMLSLVTVMDLLERDEQQLIILDTAPTGHLLRFLEMPTALGDWLAWIFKLWIKYKDVVGRVELMGRLRTLRQRVMKAQEKLKDPQYTEFIGVVQNQSAILAEAQRLSQTLTSMGISQRYVVHNRYGQGQDVSADCFPHKTLVRLPVLPCLTQPQEQIKGAAELLF